MSNYNENKTHTEADNSGLCLFPRCSIIRVSLVSLKTIPAFLRRRLSNCRILKVFSSIGIPIGVLGVEVQDPIAPDDLFFSDFDFNKL